MTWTLTLLQLALPLALLAWLGLAPLRSRLGLAAQLLAVAGVLSGLALAGIWLWPPWWMPWVYAALFLLAAASAGWRRRSVAWRPGRGSGWVAVVLLLALGGYGFAQAVTAWRGGRPPAAPVVDLAYPLAPGRYLVVNGGGDTVINPHMLALDPTYPRMRPWRGNARAVDIVAIGAWGLRATALWPRILSDYRIHGRGVVAPCDGEVVRAVDGQPDHATPTSATRDRAGNHVLLRCGSADVLLAHFRSGSVRVATGDRVRVGEPIAAVGNSGASDEPHLHIHAQTPGTPAEPFAGEPLAIRIAGRYLRRNDRFEVPE